MAEATLVLNVPQVVTLEAGAGDLRELVIPRGTRHLEYSSEAEWFYEVDDGQTDGEAGTAAQQMRIDPGTGAFRCPGSGGGMDRTKAAQSLFVAGAAAGQLWLTATSRTP